MALLIAAAELRDDVGSWFTGRDLDAPCPAVGAAGNLAHRRPHLPSDLARTRAAVAAVVGQPPSRWHLMQQVHGADVAVVDAETPVGAELPEVDAAVTAEVDRPLVVQVADCVPVLFAGPTTVGVAHAGRQGVAAGVIAATIAALTALGDTPGTLAAAIGPAIGGCCYEVPATLQAEVIAREPTAAATTTWGTPSLDLPAAVGAQLARAGVAVRQAGDGCTRCDPRWFSHREDPSTGRQIGLVVRPGDAQDIAAGAAA